MTVSYKSLPESVYFHLGFKCVSLAGVLLQNLVSSPWTFSTCLRQQVFQELSRSLQNRTGAPSTSPWGWISPPSNVCYQQEHLCSAVFCLQKGMTFIFTRVDFLFTLAAFLSYPQSFVIVRIPSNDAMYLFWIHYHLTFPDDRYCTQLERFLYHDNSFSVVCNSGH